MSLDALLSAGFKTAPWLHQIREFEVGCEARSRALLWQMRTGKTKATIDKASHLYRAGLIDALLIFAPNGVHANWVQREVGFHLWDGVDFTAAAWTTRIAGVKGGNRLSKADREAWAETHAKWWEGYKRALVRPELAVFAFNDESMTRDDVRRAVGRLLATRRCFVVFDESTDFRSPGSSRSLMARSIKHKAPFRQILDGTALHNSPLHAFGQFELLEPAALGYARFSAFKRRYANIVRIRGQNNGRAVEKITGFKNLDEMRDRIAAYASVVLRSDCEDLPPVHERRRAVVLTPEQVRVYREAQEQLRIEIAEDTAELKASTVKFMKLQQVVSGFLIDSNKVLHHIPGGNPRLEALSEEVYLAPGQCIIWCMFHEEMDQVKARMLADGWDVQEYHGRTSDEDKAAVRRAFTAKVLIGHPQSAGRGLELSAADTIIWYSHTWNAILREQAKERATKMLGRNVSMIDLVAPGIDEYLLSRVENNISVADDVAGRGLQRVLQGMWI